MPFFPTSSKMSILIPLKLQWRELRWSPWWLILPWFFYPGLVFLLRLMLMLNMLGISIQY